MSQSKTNKSKKSTTRAKTTPTKESRKRSFSLVENNLYCPWYFTKISPAEWDLDQFDQECIDRFRYTKQLAHSHFSSDLKALEELFPDDTEIIKIINKLRKQVEASSKKSSSNYIIWTGRALEQQKSINEAKIAIATQKATLATMNLAIHRIKKMKSKDAVPSFSGGECSESSASTSTDADVNTSNNSSTATCNVESDDIYLEGYDISVGNIIKTGALNIFQKQLSNPDTSLSDREKKIMSNGLSSILDLNDSSCNSQMSLFRSLEDWDSLKVLFLNKHPIKMTHLSFTFSGLWKIIIGTIKKSGDLEKGLVYLNNTYYTYSMNDRYILDIYTHFLKCIEQYPEYLTYNPEAKILENDYIRILWSPIFEALFRNDKSIRIVCSDSCNNYSSSSKKYMYHEANNVVGFKIDIRIVWTSKGIDYDLANGEVTCHSGDSKIITDEGKLTREGKDIQDFLADNHCKDKFPWIFQIVGHSINMSTIHLTTPGLYVNLPRFHYHLPATTSELETIIPNLLPDLLTFRSYVLNMKQHLASSYGDKVDFNGSLGELKMNNISETSFWKRPTYYTPPKDIPDRIPLNLYGMHPPVGLTERLLKASFCEDGDDAAIQYDDVCEYGWFKKDGRYFNQYSKGYSDKHFCCDYP